MDGKILSHKFLEFCWENRDREDFKPRDHFAMFRLRCFVGLKLFFTGFPDDYTFQKMQADARENGERFLRLIS